jgi:myo-inositol 2-dehydrogenase/D-chiro-inositol 1-dehydrogenase
LRKTRRFDDRPGARRAAAVKEAKVLCMLGFQRRYDPTFNAVKTRIEAGEIGTPELLVVTSRDRARRP